MKTTPPAALLSLVLAAFCASSAPSVARAEDDKKQAPSEEASRRFKSGVAFYKDKDYAAALVEFKHAYELLPNYAVLYNLGQTARELKDYASALGSFEKYLDEGGAKVSAGRRKEVTGAIEDLRKKVGKIKVATPTLGAEIAIDDVVVGKAPLASPVMANVGRHKISATASGYTPMQKVVDVASMEETSVELDLAKIDAGPKEEPPPPPPLKKSPPLVAWAMLGTTGAVGIAAGITGALALSARSSLKTALGTFPGNAKTIGNAQSKTRTLAITTDVLGALTVASGVATAVLFVVPIGGGEGDKTEKEKVGVSLSPSGVGVWGVF